MRPLTPYSCLSVVVGAAQIVAAVSADQLALVACQAVGAVWTDLAMMIHRRVARRIRGTRCSALAEIRRNFIIKDAGPVGKHGSEISMEM